MSLHRTAPFLAIQVVAAWCLAGVVAAGRARAPNAAIVAVLACTDACALLADWALALHRR